MQQFGDIGCNLLFHPYLEIDNFRNLTIFILFELSLHKACPQDLILHVMCIKRLCAQKLGIDLNVNPAIFKI